jgi:hypothetical protein
VGSAVHTPRRGVFRSTETAAPELRARCGISVSRTLAHPSPIAYISALTEHGARVSRCRLQRSGAEGRKAQDGWSVEAADESVTGSVFLLTRSSVGLPRACAGEPPVGEPALEPASEPPATSA